MPQLVTLVNLDELVLTNFEQPVLDNSVHPKDPVHPESMWSVCLAQPQLEETVSCVAQGNMSPQ